MPRACQSSALAEGGGAGELLVRPVNIGLSYLSLDRPSGPLSGGEAQRVKMIRHLGSALTDVTYVFDEPTIGRRAQAGGDRDRRPRRRPRSRRGSAGGEVVFEGTVDGLRASSTITGRHLDDRASLKPAVRTVGGHGGARRQHAQPRAVDVDFPLGVLVVVTGVAGSGKSSLIHGSVAGRDGVVVDQGAIRGWRRSNPATYTGLLDPIRKALLQLGFPPEKGHPTLLPSVPHHGSACPGASSIR